MTIDDSKYIVTKKEDIDKFLTETEKGVLSSVLNKIYQCRAKENRSPRVSGVVVESDWPEYEAVVEKLTNRIKRENLDKRLKEFLPDNYDPSLTNFYVLTNEKGFMILASNAYSVGALTDYSGHLVQRLYDSCLPNLPIMPPLKTAFGFGIGKNGKLATEKLIPINLESIAGVYSTLEECMKERYDYFAGL